MKKENGGDRHRHGSPDQHPGRHHTHGRSHRGHHRGGHGRLFDYGELRLVLLAMIAEEARHGYEFIKLIEERSNGSYNPSPGVIYPTLSWLDDMGYARIEAEEGGRKRYSITEEGGSFLEANRANADELLVRLSSNEGARANEIPFPVMRAMENFKFAMRLRLKRGPLDEDGSEKIAVALDAAAKTVEKT